MTWIQYQKSAIGCLIEVETEIGSQGFQFTVALKYRTV